MSGKVRYTVIFCGLILMASSALAGPDIQIGWGDYSQSPGGAFKVTVLNPVINGYAVGESFDTFCLEKKEHIAIGAKYWVSMDKVAVGGGSATGSDPLSGATAWLYNEFLEGSLAIDSNAEAGAVQKAVWALEEEDNPALLGGDALSFYNNAKASSWAANDDTKNICVLNLWADADHTILRQSQMVRIIPAPRRTAAGQYRDGPGWLV